MKKIILTLIFCGFVGAMFAQGVKFGVTAGLNVSNQTLKYESFSIEPSWKAGFQAGVFMDYAITPQLSLVPELLFTQRGAKLESDGETSSETLNYLQLPINLAYKFDLGSEQKLFPFAGIYLGYALSGTAKYGSESEKIKFGSGEEETKALDYGLNIGVGYQYTHILFKVQYNFGLANLSNSDEFTGKNKNLAVTVGYLF
ncbi:hypothetical protein FACS1894177_00570 [Bacteroidia bacterium]|nr:hypothetical protein FACS1894177_00570 [Bacteroidia bacterium]